MGLDILILSFSLCIDIVSLRRVDRSGSRKRDRRSCPWIARRRDRQATWGWLFISRDELVHSAIHFEPDTRVIQEQLCLGLEVDGAW